MEIRDTRYAKTSDGVYIAYQTAGEGPIDLAWQFDFLGNVDLAWEWTDPGFVASRSCRFLPRHPPRPPRDRAL
jgi:hypothetical protein